VSAHDTRQQQRRERDQKDLHRRQPVQQQRSNRQRRVLPVGGAGVPLASRPPGATDPLPGDYRLSDRGLPRPGCRQRCRHGRV